MYCPKCGHQNKEDAAFCIKCGIALKPAEVALPPEPTAAASTAPELSQPGTMYAPPAGYQMPPTGYQPPPGYQPTGYAPPPKKKHTGLIIGLSIGGTVLIAAAVVIILLLMGGQSAEGIWCNETHAEVLEFDDDGDMTVYKVAYEIDGSYEFDKRSGEGLIITDDRDYDFVVQDNLLIVDDQRGYVRMSDDFDVDAFIEDAAPEMAEENEAAENSEPTAAPTDNPASTASPTAAPTQAAAGTEYEIPGANATVNTPEGWYVYEDMYDDTYVMCLTDGENRYADFYLWSGSAADMITDLEDTYGSNIVGSIEPFAIGGLQAYRLQYAIFEGSCFQGYEILIDLPGVVLEMDMYEALPVSTTQIWDASSPELQLLQSIADSLRLSGQARSQ